MHTLKTCFLSKQLYDAFPALMKYLPGPHNRIFSSSKSLEAFIRREIERHKLDRDPSDPRDYIDTFLMEVRVRRSQKTIITQWT